MTIRTMKATMTRKRSRSVDAPMHDPMLDRLASPMVEAARARLNRLPQAVAGVVYGVLKDDMERAYYERARSPHDRWVAADRISWNARTALPHIIEFLELGPLVIADLTALLDSLPTKDEATAMLTRLNEVCKPAYEGVTSP